MSKLKKKNPTDRSSTLSALLWYLHFNCFWLAQRDLSNISHAAVVEKQDFKRKSSLLFQAGLQICLPHLLYVQSAAPVSFKEPAWDAEVAKHRVLKLIVPCLHLQPAAKHSKISTTIPALFFQLCQSDLEPINESCYCRVAEFLWGQKPEFEISLHLLGSQQGGARDFPPLVVIGNQFIIQKLEDAVGFHDAILKVLVLLWWSCRCGIIRHDKTFKHWHMGLNTVGYNAHLCCRTLISHLSTEDCPELLCIRTMWVYPFFNSLHLARPAAHVLLCLDVGGQV